MMKVLGGQGDQGGLGREQGQPGPPPSWAQLVPGDQGRDDVGDGAVQL